MMLYKFTRSSLLWLIVLMVSLSSAQTIVTLLPKNNDGVDKIPDGMTNGGDDMWMSRADAGEAAYGIRGTLQVLDGDIWFDSFPGVSGTYKVELGAVLEPDGHPQYALKINDVVAPGSSGEYPMAFDATSCSKGDREVRTLDIGEHYINNGDKISVWGQTTYECYDNAGAYTRWYELKFTLIEEDISSSSSVISSSSSVISSSSSVISSSSVERVIPENTFWVKAASGYQYDGMKLTSAKNALSSNTIAGTNGSTDDNDLDGVSKSEFTLDFPTSDTYYLSARLLYDYSDFNNDPNSFWVVVDGGTPIEIGNGNNTIGEWHWDGVNNENTSLSLGYLSAGEHKIEVYCREADLNSRLDVLSFSPSASYFPIDEDEVEVGFKDPIGDIVRLTKPNGGETYSVGDVIDVTWIANSDKLPDVKVMLTPNKGRNWVTIVESSIEHESESWGDYQWTIPASVVEASNSWDLAGNGDLKIKVCNYEDCSTVDMSDDYFSVSTTTTTVLHSGADLDFSLNFNQLKLGDGFNLAMVVNVNGVSQQFKAEQGTYSFASGLLSGVYVALISDAKGKLYNRTFVVE